MSPALTRKTNSEKRNSRIRDLFRARYTEALRPRKYTREYIISQIAEEFYLSMQTVEDIIYAKQ